jgi:ribosome recycling factor
MSTEEILFDVEDRMDKAVARLRKGLTGVRTGRANPGLVEGVKVVAYGSEMPLKQVATIACPEPQQILIRPFDVGTLKDIEKGIINSELGYAPNSDGKVIRLNIPPLSTEVRRKMATMIRELCEECKIAIRNVRRDGNKSIDAEEKAKAISEDERDDAKESIQELTKKYEEMATELAKNREKDVMED